MQRCKESAKRERMCNMLKERELDMSDVREFVRVSSVYLYKILQ